MSPEREMPEAAQYIANLKAEVQRLTEERDTYKRSDASKDEQWRAAIERQRHFQARAESAETALKAEWGRVLEEAAKVADEYLVQHFDNAASAANKIAQRIRALHPPETPAEPAKSIAESTAESTNDH